MAKVWGIHMPEWVGDDPIERGYVVLGWSRLGNIFEIPNDREEFKSRLAKAYPEKKPGAIPVDAGTLLRFAHEIAQGDLIVYPWKHNRMVNSLDSIRNGVVGQVPGNDPVLAALSSWLDRTP